MIKKTFFLIILSLFGLLIACSKQDAVTNAPPVKSVTITATDIAFDMPQIEVSVGQPLRLTLNNQGALEHDFSILKISVVGEVSGDTAGGSMAEHNMSHMVETPDVHMSAVADQSQTITFTPATVGEYEYICTVAGHKEAGMVGKLAVRASDY
jgi:uncharacterized cupredoxin-like copper-binding protein